MKMYVLSGGRLRMKKHIYLPGADPKEQVDLPVSCFLLQHPHGNVLFDTGCHPSVAMAPEERWGPLAQSVVPIMAPDDTVLEGLSRIGLSPGDIDIVVNSHLHCDHCGCNAFFAKATVYMHTDELTMARSPEAARRGYFESDWDHPLPTVEIAGEVDIFDDGRLVLLPLPGHSPGLTGLLVSLPDSGAFLLASDSVALRENLDLEIVPKNTWDRDHLARSLAEIKRIEKSGAQVVFGHDLAQWSTLKTDGRFYA